MQVWNCHLLAYELKAYLLTVFRLEHGNIFPLLADGKLQFEVLLIATWQELSWIWFICIYRCGWVLQQLCMPTGVILYTQQCTITFSVIFVPNVTSPDTVKSSNYAWYMFKLFKKLLKMHYYQQFKTCQCFLKVLYPCCKAMFGVH